MREIERLGLQNNFSRLAAAKVATQVLNVNELVAAITKLLGRVIGEDIQLITHLAPNLHTVVADPVQLDQIVMNLAVNARDAMPDGGRLMIETANTLVHEAEAEQQQVAPGEYIVLTVNDTGIGMDEVTKSRIFEPFFTTKRQGEGTGLGLSIVYGVVHQHKGFVTVASKPGQGTSFNIYLPRCSELVETGVWSATPAVSRGNETVLLVEDDDVVRRLVRLILANQGYTILDAATPVEALRLAEDSSQPIDILLSDVLMPEMRGPELAKRVHEVRPNLPVLFMSGYSDRSFLNARSLAGAEYIQKPFTPEELAVKLRGALKKTSSSSPI